MAICVTTGCANFVGPESGVEDGFNMFRMRVMSRNTSLRQLTDKVILNTLALSTSSNSISVETQQNAPSELKKRLDRCRLQKIFISRNKHRVAQGFCQQE